MKEHADFIKDHIMRAASNIENVNTLKSLLAIYTGCIIAKEEDLKITHDEAMELNEFLNKTIVFQASIMEWIENR